MKIFESLYKNNIKQFELFFSNVNHKINNNTFEHDFLVSGTSHNIIITFPICDSNIKKNISKWISENPLVFSKLLKNKAMLIDWLNRNNLVPQMDKVTFSAPCCWTLCSHTSYTFYILDKLIEETPDILLLLSGIDVNQILQEVAISTVYSIINSKSDRILSDDIFNCVLNKR